MPAFLMDDDDEDDSGDVPTPGGDGADLLEAEVADDAAAPPPPDDQDTDPEPAPAPAEVPPGPGTGAPDGTPSYDLRFAPPEGVSTIDDFAPGQMRMALELPADVTALTLTSAGGEGAEAAPASLAIAVEDEVSEVRFAGLEEVPSGDIDLIVAGLDGPVAVPLLTVLEGMELEDGEGGTLLPEDPEVPDEPTPAEPGGGDTLLPEDPEVPDEPTPPGADPDVVLKPVLGPEIPEGAQTLAAAMAEAGASAVGLSDGPAEVSALTEGDDTATVGGGDPGTLTLSQAAAEVTAAGGPAEAVDGGAGDDTLTGGAGAAYAFGGAGADVLTAGAGAGAFYGGSGDDVLTGAGDDAPGAAARHLLHGGAGDDIIAGGAAAEYLDGGEHASQDPAAGDDTIDGGGGDDTIRGGAGADSLSGGDGDDHIDHRGTDAERIKAEHREHAWFVDGDADTLDGGAGDDMLRFDSGDTATGGAGADVFWLFEGAKAEDGSVAVAEIADFVPGGDVLRISLDPQTGVREMAVEVTPDASGENAEVRVDGTLMAVLTGAPGASALDIYVEQRPDIFP
ncbi:hypothetical protein DXV76_13775 [Rhodobacteraceae bacterium CCMM004]|nr:hypothetical protein DXV76_13775 [Rhodobacteraceae bacterium CCMM004]